MKAKIVLTQATPIMAKVVLGHLEYEIETESVERFLKEYHYDRTMWENVTNARRVSELERANQWKTREIERIAKSEDPRKELEELIVYLNTPIAVA